MYMYVYYMYVFHGRIGAYMYIAGYRNYVLLSTLLTRQFGVHTA